MRSRRTYSRRMTPRRRRPSIWRSVPVRCQKRAEMPDFIEPETGLPDLFSRWFESRGWTPRPHQLALVDLARQDKSALLIAPTGGGKTLAGFLPSLIELPERGLGGG